MQPQRTPVLLQVNFSFDMPAEAYVKANEPVVEAVAAVPGLRWKIWLLDEEKREGGGVYLFDDAAMAQVYLDGPLLAPFLANPAIHDVSVKVLRVLGAPTAITRGPVHEFA
jgi:hypothetical protein